MLNDTPYPSGLVSKHGPYPERELLELILDTTPYPISVRDGDGRFLLVNSALARYLGRCKEEVVGSALLDFADLLGHENALALLKNDREVIETRRPANIRICVPITDGRALYFKETTAPLLERDGTCNKVLSLAVDRTRRLETEEELRASEQRLRLALDAGRMGMWEWDVRENRSHFNRTEFDLLGLEPSEGPIDTGLFFAHVHTDDLPELRRVLDGVLTHGGDFEHEFRIVRDDGEVRWLVGRGHVVRDESTGSPLRMLGVNYDVTELKLAEERIQAAAGERERLEDDLRLEARFTTAMMEALPGVVYLIDETQRPVRWNKAVEELTGRSARDAQATEPSEIVLAEDRAAVAESIREVFESGHSSVEARVVSKDGAKIPYLFTNVLMKSERGTYLLGVGVDVSEHKRLEERYRQAQKMEAVGQLAGGVAHDFNNLVTIINGYTELMLRRLEPDDPMRDLLGEIRGAGERAGSLTRQLLAFSRQQVLQPRVLSINSVVEDTENMLRRLIGEDVILTIRLDPAVNPVSADPGQLVQVLLNLAVNARDAMPQGGQLTIETRNVDLEARYDASGGEVPSGAYVMLAISDTGTGMEPATMAHVFEPFFTTKGPGKGTGLGLATVHGIVKQSGGHISVCSEPGAGTTFRIYLPRVAPLLGGPHLEEAERPIAGGSETILLVEDESAVRSLGRRMLEECGYLVLEASDGREAIEVAERHEGPIQLLVSDVVMPHLGGRQLAERMMALRPECRVLFVSGYTDDAVLRHGVFDAEYAFLQKPYTPASLAQAVRDVLDAE